MSKTVLFQAIYWWISTVFAYTQLLVKAVLFQTIQFSISTQFECQKQFYFKQFIHKYSFCLYTVTCKSSSISNNSVQHKYAVWMSKTVLFQAIYWWISTVFVYTQLLVKAVLFQTIQFSISTQFECQKQFYFKQFIHKYSFCL